MAIYHNISNFNVGDLRLSQVQAGTINHQDLLYFMDISEAKILKSLGLDVAIPATIDMSEWATLFAYYTYFLYYENLNSIPVQSGEMKPNKLNGNNFSHKYKMVSAWNKFVCLYGDLYCELEKIDGHILNEWSSYYNKPQILNQFGI